MRTDDQPALLSSTTTNRLPPSRQTRSRVVLSLGFSVRRTASFGGRDRLAIDFLDDVARLQAGLGGGGVGLDLGDDGALDRLGHFKLLAGLRIEVGDADAVEGAGVVAVLVVLGEAPRCRAVS